MNINSNKIFNKMKKFKKTKIPKPLPVKIDVGSPYKKKTHKREPCSFTTNTTQLVSFGCSAPAKL